MQPILFTLLAGLVSLAASGSPKALGPCILSRCPRGFLCSDEECVPDASQIEELGPCVNNLCPKTYHCNDNTCIRATPKAREGALAIGPCVNQQCPDGHLCVSEDYKCYPMQE
ncbi:hypothetical protein Q1695_005271 [Nippostrongylus brasiliensis]|nr:hypothetical protein Q1695_005271 [Nippostrongylus brasiliensis]